MSMTYKTFCRNCMAHCGAEVEVENDRIIRVSGDKDHPVSQGFVCVKGRYNAEFHNGDDRQTEPALKRQQGSLQTIGIDTALDEIAQKLSQLNRDYGPRSIAMFTGTGTAYGGLSYTLAKSFLSALGSPELYSTMTIDQSSKLVTAGRMGKFGTGKPFLTDADVVICCGNNIAVSHMGPPFGSIPSTNVRQWMQQARQQGTKIIVVDPRHTETARQADLFLQVTPGEDSALLGAMIKLIFDNNWLDQDFCKRYVSQMEELRKAVEPFSLDYAAERCGVDAEVIAEAAELFARAKRKAAWSGTGPSMNAHANLADHLLEALNAICGGYLRAGDVSRASGVLYRHATGSERVVPPNRSWEHGPKLRTVNIGQLFGEFPTSRLPDEILHTGEDRIRALIAFGTNPATAIPDTLKTLESLEALELLVVIDPRLTESTGYAHYVLSPKLPYERPDLTVTSDSWFHLNHVQYSPALVRGPQGLLEDWEILWELAARMELQLDFKHVPYGVDYGSARGGVQLNMQQRPSSEELLAMICNNAGVDWQQLKATPGGLTFPSRKVREPDKRHSGQARLHLCPEDVVQEMKDYRAKPIRSRTEFKYLLTARRLLNTTNSAYSNAAEVKRLYRLAPLFMHPEDMQDQDIAARNTVRVTSANGSIEVEVRPDKTMQRGVVSMPHGWTRGDIRTSNSSLSSRLISLDSHIEDINYMPRQSGIPVNIELVI